MATLRDIRNRITSVKNTAKITSAMRMVAAASCVGLKKVLCLLGHILIK